MKLKNKIIIAIITIVMVVFVSLVAIHILGTGETLKIKYPKGYTVITTETAYDNEDFIKALGYSTESFINHLQQSDIVSFAANKDNSSQFTLVERSTDLSEQIYDISDTSDKELKNIASALIKNGFSAIWKLNGRTYFEVTTNVENEQNKYCSVQYITIVGGKYYSLNYYGSDTGLSEEDEKVISKVMNNLEISEDGGILKSLTNADTGRVFYMILVSLVILAGVVLIVLLAASMIRDYLKKRRSEDGANMRIRRRK